jgi:hypothetical protein
MSLVPRNNSVATAAPKNNSYAIVLHHECYLEFRIDKDRYVCDIDDLAMVQVDFTAKNICINQNNSTCDCRMSFSVVSDVRQMLETLATVLWNRDIDVAIRYDIQNRVDTVIVLRAVRAITMLSNGVSLVIAKTLSLPLPAITVSLAGKINNVTISSESAWMQRSYNQLLQAMGLCKAKGAHYFVVGRETLKHNVREKEEKPKKKLKTQQ